MVPWTQLDAALAANAELMAKVAALTARVAELEARLNEPPKTPDDSSLPPAHGHKANKPPCRRRRKGRRSGGAFLFTTMRTKQSAPRVVNIDSRRCI